MGLELNERRVGLMHDRTCELCGDPLPANARRDQRFCSRQHKQLARRKRREAEKRKAQLSNFLAPFGVSPEPDASHDADRRFRAALDVARERLAAEQREREWSAWERAHPGTAHPERVSARLSEGLRDRDADWAQGTARFSRPVASIAERARASRALQRSTAPVSGTHPGPRAYDNDSDDPDLWESATMHDGGPFRAGYRHASAYR